MPNTIGADINAKDQSRCTQLMYATTYSHKEIVELLLDNNADIDIESNYGRTTLFYAIEEYNTEIQELLMKNGAEITIESAILMGDIETCKKLIDGGIDLNEGVSRYVFSHYYIYYTPLIIGGFNS